MVNYEKAKVYKIWSTAGDKIYIGSTTKDFLSQRMDTHRANYKRWKIGKRPLTTSFNVFDEYGLDNCFIELLEAKVCKSKDELKQFEGGYIRSMVCVNRRIEGRSKKEYTKDTKEARSLYKKDYYILNREKLIEKACINQKSYIKNNQEIVKEKRRIYYEEHKDKIIEQQKQYHEKKDTLGNKLNEQCICDCGSKYTRGNKTRHLKTVKHCQFINSLQ